ncbi:uncharacterized protein MONOS_2208 [Monocercomonoides exilis]|uniref:uncharacterized protein n=1 Tax=Monocercomonoides exilis TaxID=2049356 RepID=UPI003559FA8E|nr:hypothetical protein MONOS_2208 [Monocercomonoides exilis]|eukprot:MONOS_2208.1-p1 / transcript=MONOS_2208.1 / gene=MONOS_2208 / organism=Monocercomonoides_exilis_PA203 / gene_product=unspecified product / transcript_product=unspecified product / location=Mono_scaffold00044:23007-46942(-) / protein_length=7919 / sequence_SO=supercontig / SO=protein_coding / is_pseudo=false
MAHINHVHSKEDPLLASHTRVSKTQALFTTHKPKTRNCFPYLNFYSYLTSLGLSQAVLAYCDDPTLKPILSSGSLEEVLEKAKYSSYSPMTSSLSLPKSSPLTDILTSSPLPLTSKPAERSYKEKPALPVVGFRTNELFNLGFIETALQRVRVVNLPDFPLTAQVTYIAVRQPVFYLDPDHGTTFATFPSLEESLANATSFMLDTVSRAVEKERVLENGEVQITKGTDPKFNLAVVKELTSRRSSTASSTQRRKGKNSKDTGAHRPGTSSSLISVSTTASDFRPGSKGSMRPGSRERDGNLKNRKKEGEEEEDEGKAREREELKMRGLMRKTLPPQPTLEELQKAKHDKAMHAVLQGEGHFALPLRRGREGTKALSDEKMDERIEGRRFRAALRREQEQVTDGEMKLGVREFVALKSGRSKKNTDLIIDGPGAAHLDIGGADEIELFEEKIGGGAAKVLQSGMDANSVSKIEGDSNKADSVPKLFPQSSMNELADGTSIGGRNSKKKKKKQIEAAERQRELLMGAGALDEAMKNLPPTPASLSRTASVSRGLPQMPNRPSSRKVDERGESPLRNEVPTPSALSKVEGADASETSDEGDEDGKNKNLKSNQNKKHTTNSHSASSASFSASSSTQQNTSSTTEPKHSKSLSPSSLPQSTSPGPFSAKTVSMPSASSSSSSSLNTRPHSQLRQPVSYSASQAQRQRSREHRQRQVEEAALAQSNEDQRKYRQWQINSTPVVVARADPNWNSFPGGALPVAPSPPMPDITAMLGVPQLGLVFIGRNDNYIEMYSTLTQRHIATVAVESSYRGAITSLAHIPVPPPHLLLVAKKRRRRGRNGRADGSADSDTCFDEEMDDSEESEYDERYSESENGSDVRSLSSSPSSVSISSSAFRATRKRKQPQYISLTETDPSLLHSVFPNFRSLTPPTRTTITGFAASTSQGALNIWALLCAEIPSIPRSTQNIPTSPSASDTSSSSAGSSTIQYFFSRPIRVGLRPRVYAPFFPFATHTLSHDPIVHIEWVDIGATVSVLTAAYEKAKQRNANSENELGKQQQRDAEADVLSMTCASNIALYNSNSMNPNANTSNIQSLASFAADLFTDASINKHRNPPLSAVPYTPLFGSTPDECSSEMMEAMQHFSAYSSSSLCRFHPSATFHDNVVPFPAFRGIRYFPRMGILSSPIVPPPPSHRLSGSPFPLSFSALIQTPTSVSATSPDSSHTPFSSQLSSKANHSSRSPSPASTPSLHSLQHHRSQTSISPAPPSVISHKKSSTLPSGTASLTNSSFNLPKTDGLHSSFFFSTPPTLPLCLGGNGALVVCGSSGTVTLLSLDTLTLLSCFSGHHSSLSEVTVVDNATILLGFDDGVIEAWPLLQSPFPTTDVLSKEKKERSLNLVAPYASLANQNSFQQHSTSSSASSSHLSDLPSTSTTTSFFSTSIQPLTVFSHHKLCVTSLCAPATRRETFISASLDGTLAICSLSSPTPLSVMPLVAPIVSASFFTTGGRIQPDEFLVVGFEDSIVRIPFPLEPYEWREQDTIMRLHSTKDKEGSEEADKSKEKAGGREEKGERAHKESEDEETPPLTVDQLRLQKKLERLQTGKTSTNTEIAVALAKLQQEEDREKAAALHMAEGLKRVKEGIHQKHKKKKKEKENEQDTEGDKNKPQTLTKDDKIPKEISKSPNKPGATNTEQEGENPSEYESESSTASESSTDSAAERLREKIERRQKAKQRVSKRGTAVSREAGLQSRLESLFRAVKNESIKAGDWKALAAERERIIGELKNQKEEEMRLQSGVKKPDSMGKVMFGGKRTIRNESERKQLIERMNEFTMVGDDKEEDTTIPDFMMAPLIGGENRPSTSLSTAAEANVLGTHASSTLPLEVTSTKRLAAETLHKLITSEGEDEENRAKELNRTRMSSQLSSTMTTIGSHLRYADSTQSPDSKLQALSSHGLSSTTSSLSSAEILMGHPMAIHEAASEKQNTNELTQDEINELPATLRPTFYSLSSSSPIGHNSSTSVMSATSSLAVAEGASPLITVDTRFPHVPAIVDAPDEKEAVAEAEEHLRNKSIAARHSEHSGSAGSSPTVHTPSLTQLTLSKEEIATLRRAQMKKEQQAVSDIWKQLQKEKQQFPTEETVVCLSPTKLEKERTQQEEEIHPQPLLLLAQLDEAVDPVAAAQNGCGMPLTQIAVQHSHSKGVSRSVSRNAPPTPFSLSSSSSTPSFAVSPAFPNSPYSAKSAIIPSPSEPFTPLAPLLQSDGIVLPPEAEDIITYAPTLLSVLSVPHSRSEPAVCAVIPAPAQAPSPLDSIPPKRLEKLVIEDETLLPPADSLPSSSSPYLSSSLRSPSAAHTASSAASAVTKEAGSMTPERSLNASSLVPEILNVHSTPSTPSPYLHTIREKDETEGAYEGSNMNNDSFLLQSQQDIQKMQKQPQLTSEQQFPAASRFLKRMAEMEKIEIPIEEPQTLSSSLQTEQSEERERSMQKAASESPLNSDTTEKIKESEGNITETPEIASLSASSSMMHTLSDIKFEPEETEGAASISASASSSLSSLSAFPTEDEQKREQAPPPLLPQISFRTEAERLDTLLKEKKKAMAEERERRRREKLIEKKNRLSFLFRTGPSSDQMRLAAKPLLVSLLSTIQETRTPTFQYYLQAHNPDATLMAALLEDMEVKEKDEMQRKQEEEQMLKEEMDRDIEDLKRELSLIPSLSSSVSQLQDKQKLSAQNDKEDNLDETSLEKEKRNKQEKGTFFFITEAKEDEDEDSNAARTVSMKPTALLPITQSLYADQIKEFREMKREERERKARKSEEEAEKTGEEEEEGKEANEEKNTTAEKEKKRELKRTETENKAKTMKEFAQKRSLARLSTANNFTTEEVPDKQEEQQEEADDLPTDLAETYELSETRFLHLPVSVPISHNRLKGNEANLQIEKKELERLKRIQRQSLGVSEGPAEMSGNAAMAATSRTMNSTSASVGAVPSTPTRTRANISSLRKSSASSPSAFNATLSSTQTLTGFPADSAQTGESEQIIPLSSRREQRAYRLMHTTFNGTSQPQISAPSKEEMRQREKKRELEMAEVRSLEQTPILIKRGMVAPSKVATLAEDESSSTTQTVGTDTVQNKIDNGKEDEAEDQKNKKEKTEMQATSATLRSTSPKPIMNFSQRGSAFSSALVEATEKIVKENLSKIPAHVDRYAAEAAEGKEPEEDELMTYLNEKINEKKKKKKKGKGYSLLGDLSTTIQLNNNNNNNAEGTQFSSSLATTTTSLQFNENSLQWPYNLYQSSVSRGANSQNNNSGNNNTASSSSSSAMQSTLSHSSSPTRRNINQKDQTQLNKTQSSTKSRIKVFDASIIPEKEEPSNKFTREYQMIVNESMRRRSNLNDSEKTWEAMVSQMEIPSATLSSSTTFGVANYKAYKQRKPKEQEEEEEKNGEEAEDEGSYTDSLLHRSSGSPSADFFPHSRPPVSYLNGLVPPTHPLNIQQSLALSRSMRSPRGASSANITHAIQQIQHQTNAAEAIDEAGNSENNESSNSENNNFNPEHNQNGTEELPSESEPEEYADVPPFPIYPVYSPALGDTFLHQTQLNPSFARTAHVRRTYVSYSRDDLLNQAIRSSQSPQQGASRSRSFSPINSSIGNSTSSSLIAQHIGQDSLTEHIISIFEKGEGGIRSINRIRPPNPYLTEQIALLPEQRRKEFLETLPPTFRVMVESSLAQLEAEKGPELVAMRKEANAREEKRRVRAEQRARMSMALPVEQQRSTSIAWQLLPVIEMIQAEQGNYLHIQTLLPRGIKQSMRNRDALPSKLGISPRMRRRAADGLPSRPKSALGNVEHGGHALGKELKNFLNVWNVDAETGEDLDAAARFMMSQGESRKRGNRDGEGFIEDDWRMKDSSFFRERVNNSWRAPSFTGFAMKDKQSAQKALRDFYPTARTDSRGSTVISFAGSRRSQRSTISDYGAEYEEGEEEGDRGSEYHSPLLDWEDEYGRDGDTFLDWRTKSRDGKMRQTDSDNFERNGSSELSEEETDKNGNRSATAKSRRTAASRHSMRNGDEQEQGEESIASKDRGFDTSQLTQQATQKPLSSSSVRSNRSHTPLKKQPTVIPEPPPPGPPRDSDVLFQVKGAQLTSSSLENTPSAMNQQQLSSSSVASPDEEYELNRTGRRGDEANNTKRGMKWQTVGGKVGSSNELWSAEGNDKLNNAIPLGPSAVHVPDTKREVIVRKDPGPSRPVKPKPKTKPSMPSTLAKTKAQQKAMMKPGKKDGSETEKGGTNDASVDAQGNNLLPNLSADGSAAKEEMNELANQLKMNGVEDIDDEVASLLMQMQLNLEKVKKASEGPSTTQRKREEILMASGKVPKKKGGKQQSAQACGKGEHGPPSPLSGEGISIEEEEEEGLEEEEEDVEGSADGNANKKRTEGKKWKLAKLEGEPEEVAQWDGSEEAKLGTINQRKDVSHFEKVKLSSKPPTPGNNLEEEIFEGTWDAEDEEMKKLDEMLKENGDLDINGGEEDPFTYEEEDENDDNSDYDEDEDEDEDGAMGFGPAVSPSSTHIAGKRKKKANFLLDFSLQRDEDMSSRKRKRRKPAMPSPEGDVGDPNFVAMDGGEAIDTERLLRAVAEGALAEEDETSEERRRKMLPKFTIEEMSKEDEEILNRFEESMAEEEGAAGGTFHRKGKKGVVMPVSSLLSVNAPLEVLVEEEEAEDEFDLYKKKIRSKQGMKGKGDKAGDMEEEEESPPPSPRPPHPRFYQRSLSAVDLWSPYRTLHKLPFIDISLKKAEEEKKKKALEEERKRQEAEDEASGEYIMKREQPEPVAEEQDKPITLSFVECVDEALKRAPGVSCISLLKKKDPLPTEFYSQLEALRWRKRRVGIGGIGEFAQFLAESDELREKEETNAKMKLLKAELSQIEGIQIPSDHVPPPLPEPKKKESSAAAMLRISSQRSSSSMSLTSSKPSNSLFSFLLAPEKAPTTEAYFGTNISKILTSKQALFVIYSNIRSLPDDSLMMTKSTVPSSGMFGDVLGSIGSGIGKEKDVFATGDNSIFGSSLQSVEKTDAKQKSEMKLDETISNQQQQSQADLTNDRQATTSLPTVPSPEEKTSSDSSSAQPTVEQSNTSSEKVSTSTIPVNNSQNATQPEIQSVPSSSNLPVQVQSDNNAPSNNEGTALFPSAGAQSASLAIDSQGLIATDSSSDSEKQPSNVTINNNETLASKKDENSAHSPLSSSSSSTSLASVKADSQTSEKSESMTRQLSFSFKEILDEEENNDQSSSKSSFLAHPSSIRKKTEKEKAIERMDRMLLQNLNPKRVSFSVPMMKRRKSSPWLLQHCSIKPVEMATDSGAFSIEAEDPALKYLNSAQLTRGVLPKQTDIWYQPDPVTKALVPTTNAPQKPKVSSEKEGGDQSGCSALNALKGMGSAKGGSGMKDGYGKPLPHTTIQATMLGTTASGQDKKGKGSTTSGQSPLSQQQKDKKTDEMIAAEALVTAEDARQKKKMELAKSVAESSAPVIAATIALEGQAAHSMPPLWTESIQKQKTPFRSFLQTQPFDVQKEQFDWVMRSSRNGLSQGADSKMIAITDDDDDDDNSSIIEHYWDLASNKRSSSPSVSSKGKTPPSADTASRLANSFGSLRMTETWRKDTAMSRTQQLQSKPSVVCGRNMILRDVVPPNLSEDLWLKQFESVPLSVKTGIAYELFELPSWRFTVKDLTKADMKPASRAGRLKGDRGRMARRESTSRSPVRPGTVLNGEEKGKRGLREGQSFSQDPNTGWVEVELPNENERNSTLQANGKKSDEDKGAKVPEKKRDFRKISTPDKRASSQNDKNATQSDKSPRSTKPKVNINELKRKSNEIIKEALALLENSSPRQMNVSESKTKVPILNTATLGSNPSLAALERRGSEPCDFLTDAMDRMEGAVMKARNTRLSVRDAMLKPAEEHFFDEELQWQAVVLDRETTGGMPMLAWIRMLDIGNDWVFINFLQESDKPDIHSHVPEKLSSLDIFEMKRGAMPVTASLGSDNLQPMMTPKSRQNSSDSLSDSFDESERHNRRDQQPESARSLNEEEKAMLWKEPSRSNLRGDLSQSRLRLNVLDDDIKNGLLMLDEQIDSCGENDGEEGRRKLRRRRDDDYEGGKDVYESALDLLLGEEGKREKMHRFLGLKAKLEMKKKKVEQEAQKMGKEIEQLDEAFNEMIGLSAEEVKKRQKEKRRAERKKKKMELREKRRKERQERRRREGALNGGLETPLSPTGTITSEDEESQSDVASLQSGGKRSPHSPFHQDGAGTSPLGTPSKRGKRPSEISVNWNSGGGIDTGGSDSTARLGQVTASERRAARKKMLTADTPGGISFSSIADEINEENENMDISDEDEFDENDEYDEDSDLITEGSSYDSIDSFGRTRHHHQRKEAKEAAKMRFDINEYYLTHQEEPLFDSEDEKFLLEDSDDEEWKMLDSLVKVVEEKRKERRERKEKRELEKNQKAKANESDTKEHNEPISEASSEAENATATEGDGKDAENGAYTKNEDTTSDKDDKDETSEKSEEHSQNEEMKEKESEDESDKQEEEKKLKEEEETAKKEADEIEKEELILKLYKEKQEEREFRRTVKALYLKEGIAPKEALPAKGKGVGQGIGNIPAGIQRMMEWENLLTTREEEQQREEDEREAKQKEEMRKKKEEQEKMRMNQLQEKRALLSRSSFIASPRNSLSRRQSSISPYITPRSSRTPSLIPKEYGTKEKAQLISDAIATGNMSLLSEAQLGNNDAANETSSQMGRSSRGGKFEPSKRLSSSLLIPQSPLAMHAETEEEGTYRPAPFVQSKLSSSSALASSPNVKLFAPTTPTAGRTVRIDFDEQTIRSCKDRRQSEGEENLAQSIRYPTPLSPSNSMVFNDRDSLKGSFSSVVVPYKGASLPNKENKTRKKPYTATALSKDQFKVTPVPEEFLPAMLKDKNNANKDSTPSESTADGTTTEEKKSNDTNIMLANDVKEDEGLLFTSNNTEEIKKQLEIAQAEIEEEEEQQRLAKQREMEEKELQSTFDPFATSAIKTDTDSVYETHRASYSSHMRRHSIASATSSSGITSRSITDRTSQSPTPQHKRSASLSLHDAPAIPFMSQVPLNFGETTSQTPLRLSASGFLDTVMPKSQQMLIQFEEEHLRKIHERQLKEEQEGGSKKGSKDGQLTYEGDPEKAKLMISAFGLSSIKKEEIPVEEPVEIIKPPTLEDIEEKRNKLLKEGEDKFGLKSHISSLANKETIERKQKSEGNTISMESTVANLKEKEQIKSPHSVQIGKGSYPSSVGKPSFMRETESSVKYRAIRKSEIEEMKKRREDELQKNILEKRKSKRSLASAQEKHEVNSQLTNNVRDRSISTADAAKKKEEIDKTQTLSAEDESHSKTDEKEQNEDASEGNEESDGAEEESDASFDAAAVAFDLGDVAQVSGHDKKDVIGKKGKKKKDSLKSSRSKLSLAKKSQNDSKRVGTALSFVGTPSSAKPESADFRFRLKRFRDVPLQSLKGFNALYDDDVEHRQQQLILQRRPLSPPAIATIPQSSSQSARDASTPNAGSSATTPPSTPGDQKELEFYTPIPLESSSGPTFSTVKQQKVGYTPNMFRVLPTQGTPSSLQSGAATPSNANSAVVGDEWHQEVASTPLPPSLAVVALAHAMPYQLASMSFVPTSENNENASFMPIEIEERKAKQAAENEYGIPKLSRPTDVKKTSIGSLRSKSVDLTKRGMPRLIFGDRMREQMDETRKMRTTKLPSPSGSSKYISKPASQIPASSHLPILRDQHSALSTRRSTSSLASNASNASSQTVSSASTTRRSLENATNAFLQRIKYSGADNSFSPSRIQPRQTSAVRSITSSTSSLSSHFVTPPPSLTQSLAITSLIPPSFNPILNASAASTMSQQLSQTLSTKPFAAGVVTLKNSKNAFLQTPSAHSSQDVPQSPARLTPISSKKVQQKPASPKEN